MSQIDPALLAGKVYVAAKAAFSSLRRNHPWQTFYAFGLWTDDSLQFLHPMANTDQALADTVQHYQQKVDPVYGVTSTSASLRWSYGDWGFTNCDEGGHFDEINRLLADNFDRMVDADENDDNDDLFHAETEQLLNAIVTGLHRLDVDGFFGTGTARDAITLMLVGDLAPELIEASVQVLNPPVVAERYRREQLARHGAVESES